MLTVIGMWEPGYSLEQSFIEDTVWKQTLSAFAVNRFIMITTPELRLENLTNPEQYDTMEEALSLVQGEKVFLTFDSGNSISLPSFSHPPDAVYIFGRPGDNLTNYIQPNDHKVHIETPNNVDMLACSCVAAVLYDRSLKQ